MCFRAEGEVLLLVLCEAAPNVCLGSFTHRNAPLPHPPNPPPKKHTTTTSLVVTFHPQAQHAGFLVPIDRCVALARAAYSGADILLLDDPLSAVDPRVGQSEIGALEKEIHRMKARADAARREQEGLVVEMEAAIARREKLRRTSASLKGVRAADRAALEGFFVSLGRRRG